MSRTTRSPPIGLGLCLIVFAGPGLRTSLLGSLLVAEAAMGEALGVSAEALAILVESVVFGSLIATLTMPVLSGRLGTRRLSVAASVVVAALLAATLWGAPHLGPGMSTAITLLVGAAVLGFASAVLSPVTQGMLCRASEADPGARHVLQTVWSAGQPAGFIVGSLAGGLAVGAFGWPAAFSVPLVFAVLTVLPIAFTGSLAGDDGEDPDGPAAAADGSTGLAVLLLAVVAFEVWSTIGNLRSWIGPWSLAALVVTVVAAVASARRLRDAPHGAISLAPYGVSGFAAAALVLLVLQLPTTAEFEVLLLTDLAKTSPEVLGDRAALGNIGQLAGTALAGLLMFHRRSTLALVAGLGITAIGLAAYVAYPWVHDPVYIDATRAIVGFGSGLATPVLFVAALDRMPAALSVPAGSWLVLFLIGGTEIGLALLDMVLGAATKVAGSELWGYVVLEAAQAMLGIGLFVAALVLLRRGHIAVTRHRTGKASAAPGARPTIERSLP